MKTSRSISRTQTERTPKAMPAGKAPGAPKQATADAFVPEASGERAPARRRKAEALQGPERPSPEPHEAPGRAAAAKSATARARHLNDWPGPDMDMEQVEVRPAAYLGKGQLGIYAKTAIKRGALVGWYMGHVVEGEAALRRYEGPMREENAYCMTVEHPKTGEALYVIDGAKPEVAGGKLCDARYINHGRERNVHFVTLKRSSAHAGHAVAVRASQNIIPGEELLAFYGDEYHQWLIDQHGQEGLLETERQQAAELSAARQALRRPGGAKRKRQEDAQPAQPSAAAHARAKARRAAPSLPPPVAASLLSASAEGADSPRSDSPGSDQSHQFAVAAPPPQPAPAQGPDSPRSDSPRSDHSHQFAATASALGPARTAWRSPPRVTLMGQDRERAHQRGVSVRQSLAAGEDSRAWRILEEAKRGDYATHMFLVGEALEALVLRDVVTPPGGRPPVAPLEAIIEGHGQAVLDNLYEGELLRHALRQGGDRVAARLLDVALPFLSSKEVAELLDDVVEEVRAPSLRILLERVKASRSHSVEALTTARVVSIIHSGASLASGDAFVQVVGRHRLMQTLERHFDVFDARRMEQWFLVRCHGATSTSDTHAASVEFVHTAAFGALAMDTFARSLEPEAERPSGFITDTLQEIAVRAALQGHRDAMAFSVFAREVLARGRAPDGQRALLIIRDNLQEFLVRAALHGRHDVLTALVTHPGIGKGACAAALDPHELEVALVGAMRTGNATAVRQIAALARGQAGREVLDRHIFSALPPRP